MYFPAQNRKSAYEIKHHNIKLLNQQNYVTNKKNATRKKN